MCKQVRKEAAGIYYTNASYIAGTRKWDFKCVAHHLQSIACHGVREIAFVNFIVVRSPNRRLETIFDLVKVIAETGIRFGDLEKGDGEDLFGLYQYPGRFAHDEALA